MKGFVCLQVPEDHGEDDSSEKTPSKASKSPQKSSKRPKTISVKVGLLDGSDYEAAVEVRSRSRSRSATASAPNFLLTHPRHMTAAPWQPELSCSHCFHWPSPRRSSVPQRTRAALIVSMPGRSHQTGTSRLPHSTDAARHGCHKTVADVNADHVSGWALEWA